MIHFSFELTNAMNDIIALGATDEQINEIFNFKIKSVPKVGLKQNDLSKK